VRNDDTIAAIATALGRGGIGVVRVSGLGVGEVVNHIVSAALKPRVATLSKFLDSGGGAIDEGIALFFPSPHSYTGQDVLELQGHGGPLVLQRLLKRCLELGARAAEPGEFTRRAYLNGKLDLAQAEAVADLIDASTEQAARCAARSLYGEYSYKIQLVKNLLVELRALTEATLDFPEEDIDLATRNGQEARLAAVQVGLSALLAASAQGSLLREGVHVVLAGQPNVGKSSLLNHLARQDVAIVTEIPGTTRDAIRQSINLDGVPVHMVDTAGLRETGDPVERIGVERAWAAIEKADVVLLLIDAGHGETEADREILARLPNRMKCIRVLNKIDLAGLPAQLGQVDGAEAVWLSAKSGAGVDLLRSALKQVIGWEGNVEGVFMAHARHLEAMRRAQSGLARAAAETKRQELFAEELRLAHEALMGITGEFTSDDLLGEIFSRFCIGK
jgi:tRNA modification GTPase